MDRPLSRNQFLKLTAAIAGAQLLGCGGDDDGPAGPDGGDGRTDGGRRDGGGRTDGGGGDTDGGGGDTDGGGGDTDGGGGDTDGGGSSACSGDSIEAVIGSNHAGSGAHALSIPMADVIAGTTRTYTTGGTRTHCHSVTVTAEDFATIRAGGEVRLYSCNNTDHEYVLSCGSATSDADDPIPECGALGPSHGTGSCG